MRTISRRVTNYQCEACGAKYPSKRAAQKCERRTLEKKEFRIGDAVRARELRTCSSGNDYVARGTVIKIIGPKASDEDYENRWLGGKRVNYHVWEYRIRGKCPHCKQTKTWQYYAPELKHSRSARITAGKVRRTSRKATAR